MTISLSVAIPIILILTVISAVFSAAETAFIAASKAKLHRLAKLGDKRAQLVKNLRQSIEKLISSILLCNQLINNLANSISTVVLVLLFGDAGVVYAPIVMTSLIVIYAEVMPKIIAIAHAETTAIHLARALQIVIKLTNPITFLMHWIARNTLRMVGIKIEPHARATSSLEELRGAIDLHGYPGEEESAEERAMLHSILDLGDVEVGEIMVHRKNAMMINADLSIKEIIHQVISSPYTRIPLWKDNKDNIVGILHAKALLKAIQKDSSEKLNILSISTKPWFIPESTTLREQLQAFRSRQEHFALVVDEYGALMGVVTLEDILEEIVGEISDEHDLPLEGVWIRRDGTIMALGTITIRDLNRKFEWTLPDEEASTIAGLVLHESRVIPKVGQTFLIHGFQFRILKRVRNQITLLKITPPTTG
ncbi:MAG: hypothetical protein BGO77_06430 [Caedibacter sp. 37-49]|nr:MAG: hypothetical protein BGO77_06430 [Caedibacter sp. 37-49]